MMVKGISTTLIWNGNVDQRDLLYFDLEWNDDQRDLFYLDLDLLSAMIINGIYSTLII